MTLTAGTQLGPYEILSPIGAGGMGEVYRAKDARLGREVAVKVLPERLASDADAFTGHAVPQPNCSVRTAGGLADTARQCSRPVKAMSALPTSRTNASPPAK